MKENVKAKEYARKVKENTMYMGPSISGAIQHATVFKEGILTPKAEECVKKFPALEKLFVPISRINAAAKELNEKHSVLRTIYDKVSEKLGG